MFKYNQFFNPNYNKTETIYIKAFKINKNIFTYKNYCIFQ